MASNLVRFELRRSRALQAVARDRRTLPSIRSNSRLVARIVVRGHRRTNMSARVAAASMTCSQLSRTSRSFFPPTARATASAEWTSGSKSQPKHPGHRRWHEVRIRQRGQFDEPPAIGKFTEDAASDFQCKGCLSNAARPRQGHHAVWRTRDRAIAAPRQFRPMRRVAAAGKLVTGASPVARVRSRAAAGFVASCGRTVQSPSRR